MGLTKIAWCDYTFNHVIGCAKVHTGCEHCYAEADMDKRRQRVKWGLHGTRSRTSNSYWNGPRAWNKRAQAEGKRLRVFCASLADVFEEWEGPIVDHTGQQLWTDGRQYAPKFRAGADQGCRPATMHDLRVDLFRLIDATPCLDWLLLTKRPECVRTMWIPPDPPIPEYAKGRSFYRPNIWLGTSPCNQPTADQSLPHLLKLHDLCPVLWASYEPALGPVDWYPYLQRSLALEEIPGHALNDGCSAGVKVGVQWIVCGGESTQPGAPARPFHIQWALDTLAACRAARVPFFNKQFGSK